MQVQAAKDVRFLKAGSVEDDDLVPLVSEDEVQEIEKKHPFNPWSVVREIESLVALRQEERKQQTM